MAKAKDREATISFNSLAYLEVLPNTQDQFVKYVRATVQQPLGRLVTFSPEQTTPLRRRATLANDSDDAAVGTSQTFDKRRKL